MTTTSKNVFALAVYGLSAAALGAAVTLYAGTANLDNSRKEDHAEIIKIKDAYVKALNSGDADAVMEHLAPDLDAVMATGEEVKSAAEFKAYVDKMRAILGLERGGRYAIDEIKVGRTLLHKDSAASYGTTKEHVQAVDEKGKQGKFYEYETEWEAWLSKGADGKWRLIGGRVTVDPTQRVFAPETLAKIRKISKEFGKKG